MNRSKIPAGLFLVALVLSTAGCNGSGGASGSTGTLGLAVADTPVDNATKVTVAFTGVELQGSAGSTTTFNFSSPKKIDLMSTQNGNDATLLSGKTVDAGDYQWIRLVVDPSGSSITLKDGSVHALTIPSGSQSGLKLVSGFTVAAGSQANFTIDFDLRRAVTLANGGTGAYILKPALRLINNQQVGTVSGSASNTLTVGSKPVSDAQCGPAVYVYSGANVTPVDFNPTSSVQPLTTASLSLNASTGNYDYSAAFLAPGDYTLAVTCAANDNLGSVDSNVVFSAAKNATVTAGSTTTVDFP